MEFSSKASADDEMNLGLLQRSGEGCRNSFATLYERCYTPITRFAYRYLQDTELTEEVVNDTMLTVWEKAASFRGDSRVLTWILGIAMRKCWHMNRRNKMSLVSDELPAELPETGSELGRASLQQDLSAALTQLSSEHRVAVELAYHGGYSCEEISSIMDCPINTVKTRLHHARKALKKFFDQPGINLSYDELAKDDNGYA